MKEKFVINTDFKDLNLLKRGKVRDIYDLGEFFLIVSTDRLSAFDVIMNQGIPFKGKVLNKISEFWFRFTEDIVPNHLITTKVDDFPGQCKKYKDVLAGRSMLVKKAEAIPVECIVRGYISGSGWNDYKKTGNISGIELPSGLSESERLPEPIFTPSTKAEIGEHDENIPVQKAEEIAGKEVIDFVKEISLKIYKKVHDYAYSRGIIVADTKMEFGKFENNIILIDELFTPDSSRFWPLEKYQPGKGQESFDKQFVRDYLISINFNKQPPPPDLPEDIINRTSEKYLTVLKLLTGEIIE
ncbi:MAG: phosphoribosylaminoimidazolesuccinocarboxamide synthase [Ignavibacteriaceae bacterium]